MSAKSKASAVPPARITVLAGVNGSGKSSLMGALLTQKGVSFFNPDAFARMLRKVDASLSIEAANGEAWNVGRKQLENAIKNKASYNFETTLGANTIPKLLKQAALEGLEVVIWYCGLTTPELNIQRVAQRVAKGGHDIPEDKIRSRWISSRENLIHLLPFLTEVKVFDNSAEATAQSDGGLAPAPILLLHVRGKKIVACSPKPPAWAKPIIAAARLNA